jgi:serine phosphatase RsbU (regulator of sigma subunit)
VRLAAGRSPELAFSSSGRVLGLLPSEPIGSETTALKPGDTFVLFTDGVSEAFDANGELFGEERLLIHLAAATATAPLTATATATAAAQAAAGGTAGQSPAGQSTAGPGTASTGTASTITAGVLRAVRNHAVGTKQSDDITVVTVRYSRPGPG